MMAVVKTEKKIMLVNFSAVYRRLAFIFKNGKKYHRARFHDYNIIIIHYVRAFIKTLLTRWLFMRAL